VAVEAGDILAVLERFGLPLAFLLGTGALLAKRVFVLGSELERRAAGYERELEYREARRMEERTSRIAVEARLERSTKSLEQQAELLKDILIEVARWTGRRPDADR
jgi:hypothetical protein